MIMIIMIMIIIITIMIIIIKIIMFFRIGYDSPMKFWFRRNEIWFPIEN